MILLYPMKQDLERPIMAVAVHRVKFYTKPSGRNSSDAKLESRDRQPGIRVAE